MKVLIVGLGSIAQKHITALRNLIPNVKIYALRSSKTGAENEYVENVHDINQLDISTIDFIIISNPTSKHYESIEYLYQFKKPLFIEKPLFSEITNQTENLVKKLVDNKQITYVACNLRFLHSIARLKELVKDERINEVNVYCGSYLPNWRPNIDFRSVYSANKEMGGGVHIDLIHELDYVYWLFGKPTATNSFFANKSALNVSAYDYANYLWQYNDFAVSIILNYYRKDSKRHIEIVAESGTFFVDLLKNEVMFNNEVIFTSPQRMIDTYTEQLQFFISEILTEKQCFNDIEEANFVLNLCLEKS